MIQVADSSMFVVQCWITAFTSRLEPESVHLGRPLSRHHLVPCFAWRLFALRLFVVRPLAFLASLRGSMRPFLVSPPPPLLILTIIKVEPFLHRPQDLSSPLQTYPLQSRNMTGKLAVFDIQSLPRSTKVSPARIPHVLT
jgi:hypothetical protein